MEAFERPHDLQSVGRDAGTVAPAVDELEEGLAFELQGLHVGDLRTEDVAGATIGARVVLGDQSCIRERVTIGDDVVVGRGSLVENDTTIGALTKIQADAYITAYSVLEDNVFIAPCVVTTNDNFMGRTERRHELVKGPTIRRGARVGGAAVLCPGVEIGEEAFVGAGAVVIRDVPPRAVVVGNPARQIREVPDEELLERMSD